VLWGEKYNHMQSPFLLNENGAVINSNIEAYRTLGMEGILG
jgi:hypothetical protein